MFVLTSDFDIPPFSLPDLGSNNSFGSYVEALEEEILKKLLGKTFYDQFIAGLAAFTPYSATVPTIIGTQYSYGNNVWEALTVTTGTIPVVGLDWSLVESGNKWLLLKNGDDYVYANKNYEWKGIVKMLRPYIWYSWVKDTLSSQLTGNGVVVPDTENGFTISPGARLVQAFNLFSKLAGGYYCIENSMYGFLYTNVLIYPDYEYYPQLPINTFDL